jgi:hypothetical protein
VASLVTCAANSIVFFRATHHRAHPFPSYFNSSHLIFPGLTCGGPDKQLDRMN